MKEKFLLFIIICFVFTAKSTAFALNPELIRAGIDISVKTIAAMYQWWKDDVNVGEEIKRKRAQSMTALMEAAYNDSIQEIKRQLNAGGEINAKDYDSDTALTYAISGNTPGVVNFLINKGAYINEKTFHYAMKRNNPEILRVILNNRQFSKEILSKALISTKNTGFKPGIIMALLEAGADINYPDSSKNNETISMYALSFEDQNPVFVNALINYHGSNLYARDTEGRNALMYAAKYCKNQNVMKILLNIIKRKKFFIIDYGDYHGTTALMYAAANNTPEIVEVLLNAGANINIKDSGGNKAVDYALGWFGGNSSVKNSPVFERLGKSDKWIRPYW